MTTLDQLRSEWATVLDAGQRANAEVMLAVYLDGGYPLSLALAAIANAKAESNLRNEAVRWNPPGEWSVGLAQLNAGSVGGAGTVLNPPPPVMVGGKATPDPSDPRLDPRINTQTLIDEELAPGRRWAATLQEAARSGRSLQSLAGLFGRRIERHSWTSAARQQRAPEYRVVLGSLADAPARSIEWPDSGVAVDPATPPQLPAPVAPALPAPVGPGWRSRVAGVWTTAQWVAVVVAVVVLLVSVRALRTSYGRL